MYLERDNDPDRLQKSVYIYTFIFTGTYTGPFCQNPVRKGVTTIVLWEFSSNKEGACPKREIDTDRLQKTTKAGHRLQRSDKRYKS